MAADKDMNGTNGTNGTNGINGINGTNGTTKKAVPESLIPSPPGRSVLRSTDPEELHDLICIGFGPASLAIATALHDSIISKTSGADGSPHEKTPRVAFLERQPQFAWHAGMLLPGAKMQISFLKDMATFRDPRSEFTFLNYLHRRKRLVPFVNLSTFLPLRAEYDDYLRWCAGWFDDVVSYGQEVVDIVPEKLNGEQEKINGFTVRSRNVKTGEITTRKARHVVIAVGGKPKIPQPLPSNNPHVIHSSRYSMAIPALLKDKSKNYRVAVVGAGQSAAEIFNDLHSRYPNSNTSLIIRGSALRPSDDSPFVNEIFDPDRVDDYYHQPQDIRTEAIALDRSTNYGVVRIELLEHIYTDMYMQRLREPDEEAWQHRILNHRSINSVEDVSASGAHPLRLRVQNSTGVFKKNGVMREEILDVDAVVVATGYVRDAHEQMLRHADHMKPGGSKADKKWAVSRDYRVRFEQGAVADDAGVWLQGCNEQTHGLSDTLLSILAVRGAEIVESIFG
ncbi:putative L-ornithine 5-monooxygenase [Xylona heveae TC161]|uniref:L-ornithine N(5)-monooxygenase n=1 Tax=Xylona heveae (strain CBS 132557 / TC161) TaxID=1328760 RepID=A0A164ZXW4_XYLHT|nr:putative L-ornithine 5-monooxygenase [Xylona heveae TC161]KZF19678.1 putative L-ornithine 5-monooxygenase [Xylona heveae TC161]